MSGRHVELLRRRARVLKELAEQLAEEHPDLSLFLAEQSAQLEVKALLLEVLGEVPRTHGLRSLLSRLASRLAGMGFTELSDSVREFVAERRGVLWLLEEAYTMARYGDVAYSSAEARRALELLGELAELASRVRRALLGGGGP